MRPHPNRAIALHASDTRTEVAELGLQGSLRMGADVAHRGGCGCASLARRLEADAASETLCEVFVVTVPEVSRPPGSMSLARRGRTALTEAAGGGHSSPVEQLIAASVDVPAKDG
jgi:hypothetical protein